MTNRCRTERQPTATTWDALRNQCLAKIPFYDGGIEVARFATERHSHMSRHGCLRENLPQLCIVITAGDFKADGGHRLVSSTVSGPGKGASSSGPGHCWSPNGSPLRPWMSRWCMALIRK